MFKEEYEKLIRLIEERGNMEAILKEAVTFFEALRKTFPDASPEHKQEIIQMMSHLKAKLAEIAKKTAEEAGMSQEDLTAYAENPNNFTPDQWRMVQESKRKLYDTARKFSSDVAQKKKERSKGAEPGKKEAPRSIRGSTKRTSRKNWMKS